MGFLRTTDGSYLQTSEGNWILTSDAVQIALATPTNTASIGTAYSSTVGASGGTPAYAYSVILGSLPTGLSLHAVTGAITGTPTVTGTFTFTILVTDAGLGTMISEFTIYVTSAAVAGSGIYKIIPDQTYDELYTTIPATTQVKIPNQFVESYLIGDE